MIAESFIFMPFKLKDTADFRRLYANEAQMQKHGWLSDRNPAFGGIYHNYYLLRYAAKHVNSDNTTDRQCFHYIFDKTHRGESDKLFSDQFFCKKSVRDDGDLTAFHIADSHLYFFSSGIGILAYRLTFKDADARIMADALFQLKRAGRKSLLTQNQCDAKPYSMMTFSEKLTAQIQGENGWEFFFYADALSYRCNTLSLIELEDEDDCPEALYFLRNAYGLGFKMMDDETTNQKEVFRTAADRTWGVTSEGAACVAVVTTDADKAFTEGEFCRNFNTNYLFMFILALHQKYVLYHFLTNISMHMYEDENLENLETYQNQLSLFEKDFSFNVVTEVPQYQLVYEKLREAFNLHKMYEDVHEPLASLSELRREEREKREKKQEQVVNGAMNAISILAIFSALVDSFDLLREVFYGDGLSPLVKAQLPVMWAVLIADIGVIIILFVIRVIVPLRKRKDRQK